MPSKELAERLVRMAGKTAFDEVRKWFVPGPPVMGPTEIEVGRSVVVAVLDELRRNASPDMRRQIAEIATQVVQGCFTASDDPEEVSGQ